jgi:hypothetical protein
MVERVEGKNCRDRAFEGLGSLLLCFLVLSNQSPQGSNSLWVSVGGSKVL